MLCVSRAKNVWAGRKAMGNSQAPMFDFVPRECCYGKPLLYKTEDDD